MAEHEDADHGQGGEDIDRCDVCDESAEELYFCQACQGLMFCSVCWKAQAAHNSRKKSVLESIKIAGTLHEKTKLSTIRVVRPAFSNSADNDTIETRLAEDADAAWFGESCNT
jgi:hypothetical protein